MEAKEMTGTDTKHSEHSVEHLARRKRLLGFALTIGGTLLISPDALCVQLVSRTERSGVIVFYKYLICAVVQWLFVVMYLGGPRKVWGHIRQAGRYFLLGTLLSAGTQVTLNTAFTLTSSANALVLLSLNTVISLTAPYRRGSIAQH
jgi:drug/metabolite transporter (DMT)-like permease